MKLKKWTDKRKYRKTYGQTLQLQKGETDRKTNRKAEKQIVRQTDRISDIKDEQMNKQKMTNRQIIG